MAQLTAMEQEMLELLNRFRMNPAKELSILLNSTDSDVNSALSYFNVNRTELANQWATLVPVQPIAWSSSLNDAAANHNQLMISNDQQSHQLPGEADLGTRFTNAGYTGWTSAGENIYAYSQSVFHAHAGLAIDWGNTSTGIQSGYGHRQNMMNNNFREVGLSITPESNPVTAVGPLVLTQDFGTRSILNNKGYLLGVAFQDLNGDSFYNAGEGLRDVLINVSRLNGTAFSQNLGTMDAGGYQTLLDPGTYLVRFFRNGAEVKTQTTTVSATNTSNVKVDFIQTVGAAPAAGKGKIVGTLFNDVNNNGVQDTWEPVQSGWQVFLDNNGNKQLDAGELSTITDANGRYIFNDLAPGTYNVTEVLSSGWKQTLPNPANPIGSETYKLDDANSNGGIAYSSGDTMIFNAFTAKSANEVINSISVGLSSYGNAKAIYLYQDLNGNNAPDGNEKILELATNLTGSSGFTNIPITPTTVSGTFFVAALYQGNGSSSTFISRDTDNPAGKSWLAYSAANSFNPSSFSAFAVSGNNWLLRANTPGTLPQIVTVAANQTLSPVNFGNQEINATNNPYIIINDVLVTEGNSSSTNAVFTVKLSKVSTQIVTVNYATANQTATVSSDYTSSNGLLTFNPGEIEKTINVAVLGDTTSESDETFFVNLLNPTNAAISDNQGIGLILNDDTSTISIIESAGNTTFLKDAANKYFAQIGTNSPIAIKNGGQQIYQDIYAGWQPLAAETVNGNNQVLWKNISGNYLHIWKLDANWNLVSSEGNWALNSADAFTQETNFGIDANGDGLIGNPYTSIESAGNTKLVKDSTNKYYAQLGTATATAIKNGGQQIYQNIYAGWQTLAAETVNGDNQVLWKNISGNFLHIWSLDSNWNFVSSQGNWGLNSVEAFTQETNFGIDANGDGVIGNPYTQIESAGNTKLVKDTASKLFAQAGTNTPTAIKNGGQQIYQNIYAGWQTLAVETVNGDNQVLWKNVAGNYLHIWHLDNSWNWVSSEGQFGLNSADAFTQETNFGIDANSDGVIGNPAGNPYILIESAGNTKLVKNAANKYFAQIGTNTPIAIQNGGVQIFPDIYPGWQTLAVETVNGDNQVLWKNVAENYLHIWHLDNSWNRVSSEGQFGLNSANAFTQETNFGIDANGDGIIGNPLVMV